MYLSMYLYTDTGLSPNKIHGIAIGIIGGWNILLSNSSQSQTVMIAMFCFNQDFST